MDLEYNPRSMLVFKSRTRLEKEKQKWMTRDLSLCVLKFKIPLATATYPNNKKPFSECGSYILYSIPLLAPHQRNQRRLHDLSFE